LNIKELKITNSRDDSITFGRHFFLTEDFQISGLKANVNTSTFTSDGAHYQSTVLNVREIDIPYYIKRDGNEAWWIEEKRHEMYTVCNPKHNPIRLDFTTKAGHEFYLYANAEMAPVYNHGFEHDNKKWLKGLLQFVATDPFIYEKDDYYAEIGLWIPNFEFILEIPEGVGIEMGYRTPSTMINVENTGQEATGMIIRFKATATVKNPSLINVNTYEMLKLNTTMLPGDEIFINTNRGKRSIILSRNNVQTNVFNVLDLSSTFLQIEARDNLFRYEAEENIDFLEVSFNYRARRIGV